MLSRVLLLVLGMWGARVGWSQVIPEARVVPTAAVGVAPRIQILYARYGNGHLMASQALEKAIKAKYPDAVIEFVDVKDFLPSRVNNFSEWLFTESSGRAPDGYHLWFVDMMKRSAEAKSVGESVKDGFYRLTPLVETIEKFKPDLMFSTFNHSTELLVHLRDQGVLPRDLKIGSLMTDYVDDPYFRRIGEQTDLIAVPHDSIRDSFVRDGLSPSKVITSGIATDPKFAKPIPTAELNATLAAKGVEADTKTVLIMGGKAAAGDYPELIRSITGHNKGVPLQIIAVCGDRPQNKAKCETLEALKVLYARRDPPVRIVVEKFIPDMVPYMQRADLVVTKAGGLTSTEVFNVVGAKRAGVPVIFLDINGGQERYNIRLFRQAGVAEAVRYERDVGPLARTLLFDQAKIGAMLEAQAHLRSMNRVGDLADWIGKNATAHALRRVAGVSLPIRRMRLQPANLERCDLMIRGLLSLAQ